jgi:hypothetical protein
MFTYSSKRFVLLFLGSTTLSFFMTSILRLSAANYVQKKTAQIINKYSINWPSPYSPRTTANYQRVQLIMLAKEGEVLIRMPAEY